MRKNKRDEKYTVKKATEKLRSERNNMGVKEINKLNEKIINIVTKSKQK